MVDADHQHFIICFLKRLDSLLQVTDILLAFFSVTTQAETKNWLMNAKGMRKPLFLIFEYFLKHFRVTEIFLKFCLKIILPVTLIYLVRTITSEKEIYLHVN